MAHIDVIIPVVGESISEVVIGRWFKKDGETIQIDECYANWRPIRLPWN